MMRLKSLELIGFKSFADKIRMDFGSGMTAIVGPNGCGKSNISDSIRWVIGEQSAKALRGSRMEDCIFNGTDDRKPLGMAEVSLTLGDCEGALATEFNEVTITRRVFRSGEGQYFINKTPCRLKDIQRMFMDTGIGTSSYSLMEQGRIDQILSSHPEDRRVVFEEASGITKFKSDKKEAIQMLEHTEANLLRLADVIREVKRQIGSLQRQAGKARRYKEYREELRRLDIYITRKRLTTVEDEIQRITSESSTLDEQLRTASNEVTRLEQDASVLRQDMVRAEREIGAVAEAGIHAESKLEHARELIRVNTARIREYGEFSERDSKEIEESRKQLEKKRQELQDTAAKLEAARAEQKPAKEKLQTCDQAFQEHQRKIDNARSGIQRLREESVELESLLSKLQNQLMEIDSRERSSAIRRERLSAERSQLARVAASYDKRQEETNRILTNMREEVARNEAALQGLRQTLTERNGQLRNLQKDYSEYQSQLAAATAEAGFLRENMASPERAPAGARLLLDDSNPLNVEKEKILGEISSHVTAPDDFRTALAAALRAWIDTILITDSAGAMDILRMFQSRQPGSVRMLSLDGASNAGPALPALANRLIDRLSFPDDLRPLFERLLGNVALADSLDAIPSPIPAGLVYVTRTGAVAGGDGSYEFWMPEPDGADPSASKHRLARAEAEAARLGQLVRSRQSEIQKLTAEIDSMEPSVNQADIALDEARRALAHKEGENQVISKEAAESRERLDTVRWELENLDSQETSGGPEREDTIARKADVGQQRDRITSELSEQNKELQELEHRHTELHAEVTENRVRFTELTHQVERWENQHEYARVRISELEAAIQTRSAGMRSYETGIAEMKAAIRTAEEQLSSLENDVSATRDKTELLRRNREAKAADLQSLEGKLSGARASLEQLRKARSEQEVRLTENKMRRQNQIDRVTFEYGISVDHLMAEPAPEFQGEEPAMETMETAIAELRTKIEAMGAVNLVAIEELQELEERHTFLTGQEEDLVNAKQQLMNMIRQINRTTSEMFRATFDRINENFVNMFQKLFNGGSAKLVLVNEEDVLECGIEIIARPPGKRLQNVSLLSGGERTLTAVALLFAIYMCKPSPFCLLDELDAALDDSNIDRFVKVLKDFLIDSQFLVITHNRQTISAANTLYGVTMPEKGISTIMSVKFKDAEKMTDPNAGAAARRPAPSAPHGAAPKETSPASPGVRVSEPELPKENNEPPALTP